MNVRRRDFITLLGGAAAAWPLAARAQQADRMRRIGVSNGGTSNNPVSQAWLNAFQQELARLGWMEGRNITIDMRWAEGRNERSAEIAAEFVKLKVDVIVAGGTPPTLAAMQTSSTIPIVFAGVTDPVAQHIVPRLDRPSGNVTGFANYEAPLGGKWLQLLSEIAPGLKQAAIMFNPDTAPVSTFMPSIETAARSLKVELIIAPVDSDAEIETAIIVLGREPGGGLVVPSDAFTNVHRVPIISAAARNNVPAVYGLSYYARDGGLLSYGADAVDMYRRAASYVDRILRGEKPGDLPVQFPTKFEMVVNLKAAKALGLTIPAILQATADEVIE
jgi:putative ABC transport system substrate-binding protein